MAKPGMDFTNCFFNFTSGEFGPI